jgi:protocatechuate 3,4-dioxygenase beta subunit
MNGMRRCLALSALTVSATLAACSGSEESSSTQPTPSSAITAPADCRPTSGGEAQGSTPGSSGAPSSVKLKPSAAITPEEAAAEASARRGIPLILSGVVYASDCRTPLAGAVIEAWQTDARGVYGPAEGDGELRCCYLQGMVRTDAGGGYNIRTIRPGHYRGEGPPPPAHIHLNVHYAGMPGVLTEVVFEGDPYLPADASGPDVISLRKEGGRLVGRFDIVLGEAG